MNLKRVLSTIIAPELQRSRWHGAGAAAMVTALLAPMAGAQSVQPPTKALFAVYSDDQGSLTTNSTDPSTLNTKNPFFDPSIGANGQACVTCHEPSLGITITVPFINQAFNASDGTDPLFRFNDTANNPFTTTHTAFDYSLILNLGVVRIGKTIPGTADFRVVAADAFTDTTFAAPKTFPLTGTLHDPGDPQHPLTPTLSVFRRPLVNTNVNFDSAVLWDGRSDISNMPAQVAGAIQTLLLGSGTDPGTNQAIVNFMTGVYTDQKASNVGGELTRNGATGGVANLVALSQSPNRPCVLDEDTPPDLTPFVLATGSTLTQGLPNSCTPVTVGAPPFDMFGSWANLPNNPGHADQLSVARGEQIFNGQVGKANCRFCHTVPNLGNNASATTFKSDGTDSPAVMMQVLALATTPAEVQMVQEMIDRINQLPLYCLRPTSDPVPPMPDACNHPTDVLTTDPGRALVSGHIADANQPATAPGSNGIAGGSFFKPPILRDLAVRAPFFHAGAAADSPPSAPMHFTAMQHLVNFYNLRFGLGLTSAQQTDLVNFLNAL